MQNLCRNYALFYDHEQHQLYSTHADTICMLCITLLSYFQLSESVRARLSSAQRHRYDMKSILSDSKNAFIVATPYGRATTNRLTLAWQCDFF